MAAKRATTKRRPSYYRYSAEPKTATGSIPPWEDDGSSGNAEDVQRTRLDKTPHGHVPSTPYYGLKPHRVTGSVKKPQARSPRSVPGALQPRQTAKRPVPLPVQPFQERAPSPPVQPASPNLEQRVPYPRYAYIDPACDRACFIVASIIIGVLPIIIAIAYYFAVIFSGGELLREQTISITSTTLTPKTAVPVRGTKDGGRNLSETGVKYICVHHVLGEGVRARGTSYGINLFPVENCQMVVYCCALLSSSLEPLPPPDQPDAFDRFVDRTKSTPTGLKPKLMIGDGFTYPLNYASLFDKPYLRRAFARVMTTWCVDHGYSGIFLRWPDANHQKQLLKLVRELGNGIQRGGLTLGTVFPQDADSLSQMHLDHLAPQKSCVLLEPPKYTWGNYRGGVYSYYTFEVLQNISHVSNLMTRGSKNPCLCVMLPADTFVMHASVEIDEPEIGGHAATSSVEPEPPETSIRRFGRAAFFETCAIPHPYDPKWLHFLPVSYPMDSQRSFVTIERLGDFVTRLRSMTNIRCMGIWNPHCDDFVGICKRGPYPLKREVLNRLLEVAAENNSSSGVITLA